MAPGWVARVDRQPRPIHRVAGAIRGMVVHPGENRVEMAYEPMVFWTGAAVSLAALALTALRWVRTRDRAMAPTREQEG